MIVKWFLDAATAVCSWLLGLLPTVTVPSWFTSSSSLWSTVWTDGASMGSWVPLSVGTTVVAAVLTSIGIGFAIKVARIALSLFTAGGGSAG